MLPKTYLLSVRDPINNRDLLDLRIWANGYLFLVEGIAGHLAVVQTDTWKKRRKKNREKKSLGENWYFQGHDYGLLCQKNSPVIEVTF